MSDKKRATPSYLAADDLDQLARQNAQLTAELWIVKDRLAVLESLLVEKGVLAIDEVDDTSPDDALSAFLDRERESFIKRVMGLPPEERTIENLKALATHKPQ